jgi:hypothetical protein
VAEGYLLTRDVSAGYAANLRRTAGKMARSGITPENIDGSSLNMWLASMRASGLSSVSIASERCSALTLWRHGIEEGSITTPIRHVLRPRITRRVTRAFARDDLTGAVKRLKELILPAFQSGCCRKQWIEAWIFYVYETGARFGDAHTLRSEALVPGGVAWTASKTGRPVIKRLSASTSDRLAALASLSPDGTVFKWAVSRRHAFATVKTVFKEIGLTGGRTQWLRRSGATHAEMVKRGAAREYLCHATQGLAEKNYIDFTQLIPELPMPPGIE